MENADGFAATFIHIWTIACLSIQQWLPQHRYYVLRMSVNWGSTTSGLGPSKMQGLCGDIKPLSNYRPPFSAKMVATTSSLCPRNEHQQSVNNFRRCILEYQGATRLLWSIIKLSAAILDNNAYDRIVTMSQNERQCSVNNVWSCIFDNLTVMERR